MEQLKILKNVALIGGGTAAAQVITALALVILTRIYTPHEFGFAAIFTSFLSICTVVGCLRYEQAILITDGSRSLQLLYSLCLKVLFFVCTIYLIFISALYLFNGGGSLGWVIFLLPFVAFFNGWLGITQQVELKVGDPKYIGIASVLRALVVVLAQVVFFFLNEHGLIVGQVMGILVVLAIMLARYPVVMRLKDFFSISDEEAKIAGRYVEYPKFNAPHAALSVISQGSAPVIISVFYSANYVGLFAIADRLINIPISLVSVAVRQVLTKSFAESSSGAVAFKTFIYSTSLMLSFGVVFSTVVYFFGVSALGIVLGDEWRGAGYVANGLALWMITLFASAPAAASLVAKGKTNMMLTAQYVDLFFKGLFCVFLYLVDLDFYTAVMIYGAASSVYGILIFVFALKGFK